MIYTVEMVHKIEKSRFIMGYTDDIYKAKKYKHIRENKNRDYSDINVKYVIKEYSDEIFAKLQRAQSDYGAASLIMDITDDVCLSDDDMDYILSTLDTRLDRLEKDLKSCIDTLKYFNNPESKKLIKNMKEMIHLIDCEDPNYDPDIYSEENINWDRVLKKIVI